MNSHLIDISRFTLTREYQSKELEDQLVLEEKWCFRNDIEVFVKKITENS